MLKVLTVFLVVLFYTGLANATTWYVRPDGGTRFSSFATSGQCDGQADVAYPGSGTNQHCAYNDFRYMWSDNTNQPMAWVIAGGDTVILRGCHALGSQENPDNPHCRLGYDNDTSGASPNAWCGSGVPNVICFNPPIPAGTSGAHTKILGQNFASCGVGQKTQLFGGFGLLGVINMFHTSYVDLECLELTDHSSCMAHGTAGLPSRCSTGVPYSDYSDVGLLFAINSGGANLSGNILLQDVDLHGFPSDGLAGAIGGAITMVRVTSNFNGFAGWDFDYHTSGNGIPNNPLASINASYVTMNWNGCNEEYPIVDSIPATYCYSILNNGFGDAWSGQDSDLASMTCDHCEMSYNVKDAFFGPHTAIGNVTITNSVATNNGGQTWKANLGSSGNWTMKNTLTNNNCHRLKESITGAPSTFNLNINNADMCRADGATIAVVWPIAGSFELDNNTFVAASQNVGFDFTCWNTFSAVSVGSGGSGYSVGDVLYPGGTQASVTVTSVGPGGVITGISLTNGGQVTNASVPFTETYVFGGTGSGATITVNAVAPVNCGGGPRIMRNNVFIGYTNPDNLSWNGQLINALCYATCNETPGDSNDSQWSIRTDNYFFGWGSGLANCSYAGETCGNPLLKNQPATTMTTGLESALDVYNPFVSNNSFYPTGPSPLIGAGTPISGLTSDYYGVTRPNPPSIGGVELQPSGVSTVKFGNGAHTGNGVRLN